MKLRVFFRLTINISDDEQLEGQNDENRDILDETGSEFVSVASSLNFQLLIKNRSNLIPE